MTIEEKLRMYREKRQFAYELAMTFIKVPAGHAVIDVQYEVFFKEFADFTDISEWITVTYVGGGKAHRCVTGNSNAANFEVVATVIYGGHYDQNLTYAGLADRGYKKLDLNKMGSFEEVKCYD
jgi:hypothetical protein